MAFPQQEVVLAEPPEAVRLADHAYQQEISFSKEDVEWDSFLKGTAGAHHAQSSCWAGAKHSLGWSAFRVILKQEGKIVAGAQVLMRDVSWFGKVCYMLRGPVVANNDPSVYEGLLRKVQDLTRRAKARMLIIQLPTMDETLVTQLPRLGFQRGLANLAITATIRVDLSQDLDTIFARMRRKTRQHIRRGQKAGMRMREGSREDLSLFHSLLSETAQRQGFTPEPLNFFENLWKAMEPVGGVKLFFAELEGEPVTGLLTIPFSDSIFLKRIGWNGNHAKLWPNEVLHWEVIQWAKAHGCHYCDFEEVDPELISALDNNAKIPPAVMRSPSFFKLGFGGELLPLPDAYLDFPSPLLRCLYRCGVRVVTDWSVTRGVIRYLWSRLNSR